MVSFVQKMLEAAILFAHFCKLLRDQIPHQALQRIPGTSWARSTDVSHPVGIELTSPRRKPYARTIKCKLENLDRSNPGTKLAGRNTRRPSPFCQVDSGHIDDVTTLQHRRGETDQEVDRHLQFVPATGKSKIVLKGHASRRSEEHTSE